LRAVIQRVHEASVAIDGQTVSSIGKGLLVYLGLHQADTQEDSNWMIKKVLQARVFENGEGKMSLSVADAGGEILVVSQITLYGDMRKGNRPDMTVSMKAAPARDFYAGFMEKLRAATPLKVADGRFAAMMDVHSVNDGPITVILDSGR